MNRIITKNWLRLTLVFLISFSVTLVSARSLRLWFHWVSEEPASSSSETDNAAALTAEGGNASTVAPEFLDLQPIVDDWAAKLPTTMNTGVIIYDLGHDRVAGSYQPDKVFSSASLYDLFLAYDGYARISEGELDADSQILSNYTYGECLALIVRQSDDTCTEAILAMPNQSERMQDLINRLALDSTTTQGTYTSATDMSKLLQLYWQHPDLTNENWVKLAGSMSNQPPVEGNEVRQGLPAGFTTAEVLAKVGWEYDDTRELWQNYNEATIVKFPELQRNYIIVVLAENVADPQVLTTLGEDLENVILRAKTFSN